MTGETNEVSTRRVEVVKAQGEEPVFKSGDAVTISVRFPIGHFRVPNYIRGKRRLDRVRHRASRHQQ